MNYAKEVAIDGEVWHCKPEINVHQDPGPDVVIMH